jgi:hypothetical protein
METSQTLSESASEAISWGLYLTYFLVGAAIVSVLVLFVWNAIKDTRLLIRSAIGAVALGGLYAISFLVSGSEITPIATANAVDETSSQLIGGGLIMFYIVFGLAALGLVYSEINKALK